MTTHEDERYGTLYLLPKVGCQKCVANPSGFVPDKDLCRSLPPCGQNAGWASEAGYIEWLDQVRMK